MLKTITKKIKLFLLISSLFMCFNQNNTLLCMEEDNTGILADDMINKIFIDYAQKNPNIFVKDFLKFLVTQAQVNRRLQGIAQPIYNNILNFCKQNRLDITTLKISQYFEFYRECIQDSDYDLADLQKYQYKDYYKDLTDIPKNISDLINDENININNLLEILSKEIDSMQNAAKKRITGALILNLENLCEIYKLDKEKSLVNEIIENIHYGTNKKSFSASLFLGLNPNKDCDNPHFMNIPLNCKRKLLHWAAISKEKDFCLILLEYGANPNGIDAHGFTPLHIAAITGLKTLIEMLLDFEANPYIRNIEGKTPLNVAKNNSIKRFIQNYEPYYEPQKRYKTKPNKGCCLIM